MFNIWAKSNKHNFSAWLMATTLAILLTLDHFYFVTNSICSAMWPVCHLILILFLIASQFLLYCFCYLVSVVALCK